LFPPEKEKKMTGDGICAHREKEGGGTAWKPSKGSRSKEPSFSYQRKYTRNALNLKKKGGYQHNTRRGGEER